MQRIYLSQNAGTLDNYLLGCYTDETCGGLKQPQPFKKEHVDNTRVDQTPKEHEYIVGIADTGNGSVSVKRKTNKHCTIFAIVVFLLATLLFLYSYYQRKHKKHKKYSIKSPPNETYLIDEKPYHLILFVLNI